jgi:hypothetical protein
MEKATFTSDAGDAHVEERHIFWKLWTFRRFNNRPVNAPYCMDHRKEVGFRFGTYTFAMRRTRRVYTDAYPAEYLDTAF